MSNDKKRVRQAFRDAVFKRDRNVCRVCGLGNPASSRPEDQLDAHHITDRTLMPNGGYVKENGISLCPVCHEKAEAFHRGEVPEQGFSLAELYALIGSSYGNAVSASERLSSRATERTTDTDDVGIGRADKANQGR